MLVQGLPEDLEVDEASGLIFGEANETGDFALDVTASNPSGSDNKIFNDPMLTVLKEGKVLPTKIKMNF